ncbi:hypothetical protein V6N11_079793 [Hibiscus sabdariffa]|uniref:Retrovirus-related Pol polyprotein from transposon TNT 1-94-like beta-barrel domain-containing protein n=1 Tax=Hibiscus sabdariffa TaxID=183260 RepID=A0ABR2RX80_9ROSI
MTSTSGSNFYESQSITKPPFFNGDNYPYWKNRMMLFIKSNDYQVWDVVEDGPFIPMKREGDRLTPKVKVEMTDDDRIRMQVNDKALCMLFCALGPDMYSKMSSYTSAKEGLGEVIPKDKLVRKLLYSLPESWDSKRTAIIEAKDLKTLKLDALMGSLLTHEIMKQGREDEKKREEKKLEKKEVEKKKIGIALKASQEESGSSGEEDDEEMAMLAKRFTRSECPQLKKKSFGKKKKLKAQIATWSDEESPDKEEEEVANLCLMALEEDSKVISNSFHSDLTYDELLEEYEELQKGEHCYKAKASCANSWYLDSGCSRHMTGDKSKFLELKPKSGGVVTFGDNSKRHIEGIGSIGIHETNGGEQSSKVDEIPTKEEAHL